MKEITEDMVIRATQAANRDQKELMTRKKKQPRKKFPRFTIERFGTDDSGHLLFVDLHDEKFGEAIFFGKGSRHFHGFLNQDQYVE